jgi:hypothetical protein
MRRMAVFLSVAILTRAIAAHEHTHPPAQILGTVRLATSCSAAARTSFTRAVALLHSFVFPQAVDGFNAALKADPKCVIAYWGLALSAWGNPFAAGIKPDAQLQRGIDATRLGRAIDARTDREREYLVAVPQLFENVHAIDQRTRVLAYRDAMARLSARYPDDSEASIFYALALVFSADPADKTYANQLRAGAILEKLEASHPDHRGLAHYIIHSYDVRARGPRANRLRVPCESAAWLYRRDQRGRGSPRPLWCVLPIQVGRSAFASRPSLSASVWNFSAAPAPMSSRSTCSNPCLTWS